MDAYCGRLNAVRRQNAGHGWLLGGDRVVLAVSMRTGQSAQDGLASRPLALFPALVAG